MAGIPDHYSSLGLGAQASQEEIRDAYRRRVKDCHPDITGSPAQLEDFRAAREAYEVLGNPEKRREYDNRRSRKAVQNLPLKREQAFRPRYSRADIELVLSPEEAARGGRFIIPLSSALQDGCIFCSGFRGFFTGPCPFCGALGGGASEAVIDLPPGVAHCSRFVLNRGSQSMFIAILIEEP